ncbi:Putative hydroxypyruvate isomerase YgbM [Roseovarius aestuarii]|uniref:Putative hydroxypyruvate isomerase YgbM n=2 Tax=Roseovarius aestuarii TaxID=475083 RepID=A0A1X7BT14_9RHOB|nr:Putative hydroxypyruvate isomerase YgbM [Roseovarius aestuarii]
MLFKELSFIERIAAAKDAGFDAVEVLFPYDEPRHEIAKALKLRNLPLILINTPPPNWTGGERGFAAIPGGEDRFRHDFKRAMRYAGALKSNFIHIMSGAAEGPAARSTFVANLRWAAAHAPQQQLTIEPINTVDMPGYFLNDFDMALDILSEVAAPNLGLQFDAYHAHKIIGNMLATWDKCRDHTVHIQVSDPEGRHEPSSRIIDYPAFFAHLDAEGYRGYVSGEYHPRGRTEDGLDWIR